ncbi:MAG: dethiobiotin synthase [Campylobacterales bacterium]|nr:dethiobiotin synthase [Campylobacterales bacterium]
MAKRIFITATNTDIGKTYTTKLLIEAYSKIGLRVGVYKPIETGVVDFPVDGKSLFDTASSFNPALSELSLNDIVTLQFTLPAAPYVANGGAPIDLALFERALEKIETLCDIVLIEGAGGLFVPVDNDTMMIDLPRRLDAVTLLVTHCRLGCINDTLLSIKALQDTALPYVWGFNCRDNDVSFENTSLPYFKDRYETLHFIRDDIDTIARALLDTITQA